MDVIFTCFSRVHCYERIMITWFVWINVICHVTTDLPDTIRIGGLFEHSYRGQEQAFRYSVEKINSRRDVLPNTRLTYDIQQSPTSDSFVAAKRVCRQMKDGVAAIFGPMSTLSSAHVQSICDALEIPHIETKWTTRENYDSYSINLFPDYRTLSQAYLDLLVQWGWNSFTILYENNEGLLRLQEVLKTPRGRKFQISVRRLEHDGNGDYRGVLKEIRNRAEIHIILDCHYSKVHEVLQQARSIDMMTSYYHYLLTSLDLQLVNMDPFIHGDTNVTGFRFVNPSNPQVIDVSSDWRLHQNRLGFSPMENDRGFTTETALMYDAVHLFAKSLDEVSRAQQIETMPLLCSKTKTWSSGNSILNYMKMSRIDGLTGKVQFDDYGRRTVFTLDLIELGKTGLVQVGTWNSLSGINITKGYNQSIQQVADALKNRTLVVTTILEQPYVMEREDPTLTGNDRYEGFCVDLLKNISDLLEFNYTIKLVDDDKYGAPDSETGIWNGMVGELIDKKADLAVASLTISWLREQVIDFTKPFMNLGISIIFKKPDEAEPSLWSFLHPLSFDIWVYMVVAYLVVSFVLFVLARFSPYEWYNPHPCNPDSILVENQFTIMNSMWFTIGSLMQQGSEVAPRATSTRIVSGIWWFFTLIMISSYTANLAAFLTVERMTSPIENADDLSKQTKIKYGTITGGSTMTFFKTSKIETYERMWNFMEAANPGVFENSTTEGLERVKGGGYAFLLESTMNEYFTQRDCTLMQVGGLLDSKGYGIGTPRGSKYRDLISNAILKLQEDQTLQVLYDKWWKQKGASQCAADDKGKDANALAINNVGGVFVVLAVGIVLSVLVALAEFAYKSGRDKHHTKPLCTEICSELRLALSCFAPSTRPVRRPQRVFSEPTDDLGGDGFIDTNGMSMMPIKMTPPSPPHYRSRDYEQDYNHGYNHDYNHGRAGYSDSRADVTQRGGKSTYRA